MTTEYTFSDIMTELNTRFEASVRATFDHYKGLPGPLFVLIANVSPQTGKRYDNPTPCPVDLQHIGPGVPSSRAVVQGVKRQVLLTESVAAFCAYINEHGLKMRVETKSETHEWLLPVLRDPQQTGHFYLGQRIDFAAGRGEHARTLDELDTFGGMFDKSAVSIAEA